MYYTFSFICLKLYIKCDIIQIINERRMLMARDVVSAKLDIIFKKLFTENKDMLHSFVASMLDVPQ